MKIGRIRRDGPDGDVARLVSVDVARSTVTDLATAYRHMLVAEGASVRGAAALAGAHFPGSLTGALETGPAFRRALDRVMSAAPAVLAAATCDLADVELLSPVDPPVLRDFNAFKNHEENTPSVWFEVPLYFKINPTTVVGPDAQIVWPGGCSYMDYELELGLVIGKRAGDLTPETAGDVLFGVTVFNDASVRNLLLKELPGKLGPAKGKDFSSAIGPWVVTTDELDLRDLEMTATVNGELWSKGNSGSIRWSIEEILSYASSSEPLVPGEVIGTGTVAGGSGWENDRRLEPGDVVELTIDGIGTLRNSIGRPGEPAWTPRPRNAGKAE